MSDKNNSDGNTDNNKLVFARPIKAEPGTSSGSPDVTARLPSLKKSSLDFTLGGKPKKTFVPNLNKKKTKKKSVSGTSNSVRSGSEKKDKSSSLKIQGRVRPHVKKEFVQAAAVFAGGSGAAAPSRTGGSGFRRASSSSVERKPAELRSIRKIMVKTENVSGDEDDLEQRTMEEVLTELDKEAGPFIENIDCDWEQQPINVVLKPNLSEEKDLIKKEDHLGNDSEDLPPILKEEITGKKATLFQLPSVLPISSAASAQSERMPIKKERHDDPFSKEAPTEGLGDGHIGKFQILKSGKCRMVIGDVVFDVLSGLHPPSLQSIRVLKMPPKEAGEGATGELHNVGEVINTVVSVLDVERYL